MKNLIKNNWLSFAIIAIAAIWGYLQLSTLPEMIPTHFDLNGTADKYSSKDSAVYLLPSINVLLILFVSGLMKISPKGYSAEQSQSSVGKFLSAITLFLMLIYFAMIKEAIEPNQWMNRILPIGFSILTIMMGNYFGKIERNFIAGFRLPWTLASDENWKQTHRFAGKAHVILGSLSLMISFIYPAFYIALIFMAVAAISTVGYSYNFYKKHENSY